MKKLNLSLNYHLKPDEQKNFPKPRLISEYLFRTFVQLRYPQGMNRTDTRTWGRLMDLMGDIPDGQIEIENSELLWLCDVVNWCLDNSKVPPLMASWVNTLLAEIERIKNEGPQLKSVRKEDG